MDPNSMKNTIVLKNLPSNMVEEAYVVFKDNVKIHKIEKAQKNNKVIKSEKSKPKEYIVKEAEMVIKDYISKIEQREYEIGYGSKKLREKYKRMKALTIFLSIFSLLFTFSIIFK